MSGRAWIACSVVMAAVGSFGSPSRGQETIGSWDGSVWVEWEVPPELWVQSADQPSVETVLEHAGLNEFEFERSVGCGGVATEMLFVRSAASGTPTIAGALTTLTDGSVPNPWFWTLTLEFPGLGAGGRVIREYSATFVPGTSAERAAQVVEELGVGELAPEWAQSPPHFRVISAGRSGLDVIADLNELFEHPEVEGVSPFLAVGCPSGGGAGGGGGGAPAAEIPTLRPGASVILCCMVGAVGIYFLRRSSLRRIQVVR